jgi:hypothetical protein
VSLEPNYSKRCSLPPGHVHTVHSVSGWVGPRASEDAVAKREIPALAGNQIQIHPACSLFIIQAVLLHLN